MANNKGSFDPGKLKAFYQKPNMEYVLLSQVEEYIGYRQQFDLFLAIGLTLMGVIISKFNLTWFVVGLVSLGVAAFYKIKGYSKFKKMKDSIK